VLVFSFQPLILDDEIWLFTWCPGFLTICCFHDSVKFPLIIIVFWKLISWNSWNHFHCKINEEIIREIGKTTTPTLLPQNQLQSHHKLLQRSWFTCAADAMVDKGLAKLGYEYINIGSFSRFLIYLCSWYSAQLRQMRTEQCETADDCWAAYDRDSQVNKWC